MYCGPVSANNERDSEQFRLPHFLLGKKKKMFHVPNTRDLTGTDAYGGIVYIITNKNIYLVTVETNVLRGIRKNIKKKRVLWSNGC